MYVRTLLHRPLAHQILSETLLEIPLPDGNYVSEIEGQLTLLSMNQLILFSSTLKNIKAACNNFKDFTELELI